MTRRQSPTAIDATSGYLKQPDKQELAKLLEMVSGTSGRRFESAQACHYFVVSTTLNISGSSSVLRTIENKSFSTSSTARLRDSSIR